MSLKKKVREDLTFLGLQHPNPKIYYLLETSCQLKVVSNRNQPMKMRLIKSAKGFFDEVSLC